jgi:hypothetical protein
MLSKLERQAIRTAPANQPIPLSIAADFLRVTYDHAWKLQDWGKLKRLSNATGREVYVTASSLVAYRAEQKAGDRAHRAARKAIASDALHLRRDTPPAKPPKTAAQLEQRAAKKLKKAQQIVDRAKRAQQPPRQ